VWGMGVGEGAQELCALHDGLERPLLELGCYRREERKYKPHITLGRVRSERATGKLADALTKQSGWQGGQIQVSEILVLSSQLTPKGPVYSVLSRAKQKPYPAAPARDSTYPWFPCTSVGTRLLTLGRFVPCLRRGLSSTRRAGRLDRCSL